MGEPSRRVLIQRILGSYVEMPGLRLTLSQAAKLFGVNNATALVVLGDLVSRGALARDAQGQYLMPSAM
jgi:Fic family protein